VELREIGEFGLIARIRDRIGVLASQVYKGIGDDAAVSFLSPGMDLISTVDLLVEDVHFNRSLTCARDLGRKSLAVNLSDLAAMGGTPRFALISLAVPAETSVEFIDEFLSGFLEMGGNHGVSLIGGDTSCSPDRLFISVTLLGEGKREKLVYRDGARPGDDLYVTGTLGDSLLGLHLARNSSKLPSSQDEEFLLRRHFNPTPRVQEGRILAERSLARAMIDISDGLYSDLRHICEESHVGATVWAEQIPLSAAFRAKVPVPSDFQWQWALKGGEDYELLFSASPEKAGEILIQTRAWPCGVTWIGKIEPFSHGVVIRDRQGAVDPAILKGYDHFA